MYLTDQLLDLFLHWLDAPLVKQAAGEVARECRTALWQHVRKPVRGMSLAQSRGYVRAVAPRFVAAEVDAVLSRRRANPSLRTLVIAQAVEEVIDLLVDDIRYAEPADKVVAAA